MIMIFIYLSRVSLWNCATPVVICVGSCVFVMPFVDRAFEPVEGSYFAQASRTWVHPTMATTPRVT
jgi:hypothetical protein